MKDMDKSKAQQIIEPSSPPPEITDYSGNFYKYILDQLPLCTIVYDSKGKVIFRNKASKLISGHDDKQLLGLSREEYFNKLKIKAGMATETVYPRTEAENFKEGIFGLAETTLLTRDGEIKDVLLTEKFIYGNNDELIGACGCTVDISDYVRKYKRVEAALLATLEESHQILESLKKSQEFFQKTFNAGPSLMLIYNFNDSRIIDINENFLNVMGYSREEVIGRTTLELDLWVNTADRELIRKLIITGKKVSNQEILLRKKTGEIITALYSAETINISNDTVLLASINDITRNKQMDRNLARLERLNLIGQMAAGIGHEIRNPMTTVRGFLQMLGAREECARNKGYYDLMIEELDRANSIISEFLSLARDKPTFLERTNLNSIVNTLFPLMMADAATLDMDLQMELRDIPELYLDEKEIRQLILNLFRNGLEAMAPGGRLVIKTFLDGDEVVLAVIDQGNGIEPDVLEKISTPFFTTKENGTGLGLAVCYSIASRNNATVKIETGPTGSAFLVRFKI